MLNFSVPTRIDNEVGEFTIANYARILTPLFVPDPFAIYLDSDFLVTRPISGLLPFLASGKAVGAVQKGRSRLQEKSPWGGDLDLSKYAYVNSGLILMNLDKWRKDKIAESLLAFLAEESERCLFVDESAINWVLRDDIDYLPHAWNVFANDYDLLPEGAPGEINLHYASGLKPWKRPLPTLSHQIWWQFNRAFPSASAPSNPLWKPGNLLRYVRHLGERNETGIPEGSQLKDWARYWSELRAR